MILSAWICFFASSQESVARSEPSEATGIFFFEGPHRKKVVASLENYPLQGDNFSYNYNAFYAGSLGLSFPKESVQKYIYKEASAIFKYSPSLSVLFRYNCLLMFQLLSLFLSLFHGREISEARNFEAQSIPNLATNSEVDFLRSKEPPVVSSFFKKKKSNILNKSITIFRKSKITI